MRPHIAAGPALKQWNAERAERRFAQPQKDAEHCSAPRTPTRNEPVLKGNNVWTLRADRGSSTKKTGSLWEELESSRGAFCVNR